MPGPVVRAKKGGGLKRTGTTAGSSHPKADEIVARSQPVTSAPHILTRKYKKQIAKTKVRVLRQATGVSEKKAAQLLKQAGADVHTEHAARQAARQEHHGGNIFDAVGHAAEGAAHSALNAPGAVVDLLNKKVADIPNVTGVGSSGVPVSYTHGGKHRVTVGDVATAAGAVGPLAEAARGVSAASKAASAASDVGTVAKAGKDVEQAAKATSKLSKAKSAVKARPRPIKTAKAKVAETKPVRAVRTAKAKTAETVAEKTPKPVKAVAKGTRTAAKPVTVPLKVAGKHPLASGAAAVGAPGAVAAVKTGDSSKLTAPWKAYESAIVHHPGDVLGTTARAIPGLVTAPVGIAANVGLSGYRAATTATGLKHYSGKEIVEPTKKSGEEVANFATGMAKTFSSGDQKKIEEAIRHDYGLTPALIAGIPGAKFLHDRVSGPRELRTPESGAGRIPVVRNRRVRKAVSRETAASRRKGEMEAEAAARPVVKNARKIKGARKTIRGRKQHVAPEDTIKLAAEEGIRTKEHAQKVRQRLGPRPNLERITAHDAADYLIKHPETLKDPHYQKAVEAYREQAKKIETSPVKKYSAQALTHGVKLPEQRYADIAAKEFPNFSNLAADSPRRTAILNKVEAANRKSVEAQFVKDVQAVGKQQGLAEPAYSADVNAARQEFGLESEPAYPQRTAQKQHKSENILRKAGTADQSFGTLIQKSIISPRMRREVHANTERFVEQHATPIRVQGPHGERTVRYATSEEIRKAVEDGQLDPNKHAVFDSQHFRQAVLDKNKPEVAVKPFTAPLDHEILTREAEAAGGLKLSKGKKYAVVDKHALDEFASQHSPVHVPILSKLQRASSAAILGYSPAWLISQPLAEGAQALAAVGPINMARGLAAYKKLSPEAKRQFDAEIGGTSGIGSVQETALSLGGDLANTRTKMGKALERSRPGRIVRGTLTGRYASAVDRRKGVAIRRAAVAGHVAREYNSFRSGLKDMLREQDQIARTLKGQPLTKQLEYFAKHPEAARKLESYADDVMGNWTALTKNERLASSVVIFYPFVRMSLEWTFHTFPARHPFKASILHFLGQENANQVKQLLGGNPSYFTQWASAPLYAGRGKNLGDATSLLPLQRIAPGSNALIEAVGQGKGPRDLAKVLNPAISVPLAAIGGYDPATGKNITGQGEAPSYGPAAKSIIAGLGYLPAPIRLADTLAGGKVSRSLKGKPETPTSKLFDVLQGSPLHQALRSSVLPFAPQKVFRQKQLSQVGKLLNYYYDDPRRDEHKSEIYAAKQKGDMSEIDKRIARADFAKAELQRLYKRYGTQGKDISEPALSAIYKRLNR